MFTFLFLASFFYVNEPTVFLKENPTDNSEVVSQVYFSEEVTPLAHEGEWTKVENKIDSYQGWLPKKALCERQTPFIEKNTPQVSVSRLAAHLYLIEDTVYGPYLTLPYDSKLALIDRQEKPDSRWLKVGLPDGKQAFIQRGDVVFEKTRLTKEALVAFSHNFLGLPYTWGGRSSFGYDCSGFVQMLYRQMNIDLPRDSKDQYRWEGFEPISFENIKPGDLVFFGLEESKIRHVGLYLGDGKFIHSTVRQNAPYLRISSLSEPDWNGSGYYSYRGARTLKP